MRNDVKWIAPEAHNVNNRQPAPEVRNVNNRRWSAYPRGTGGRRLPPIQPRQGLNNGVRTFLSARRINVQRGQGCPRSTKAESLTHTSVGQGMESRRPTYGVHNTIKAVSLAHEVRRLSARLSALINYLPRYVGRRDSVPCPTLDSVVTRI